MPVLFLAIAVGLGAIIFGTPGRKMLKRRRRARRTKADTPDTEPPKPTT